MSAGNALIWRALADSRARTASFALLFAVVAAAQVIGYRDTYPTRADRIAFAKTFGDNNAIRLFYGVPHDLLSVGGYVSWRVGGFMSIFAAVWGVLAAVRALRTEEDTGRLELLLAAPVGRRRFFLAALAAIAIGAAILWLAMFAGLALTRLPAGGSAFLALAVVSPVPVFAGVGALASQIAPNRRLALALSLTAVGVAFALRVIADTTSGAGWLRWATPLGWVEELRPFAGPRPAVLMFSPGVAVVLVALAMAIAVRRDVGSGLLQSRDASEPRFELLSSPLAQALRGERGTLVAWLAGVGLFAFVVGVISDSFASGLSSKVQHDLERLGGASLLTPTGALSFYFVFFLLVISLFMSSQVTAARHEEAEQRLETLFAGPVSRRRWLAGRVALAAGGGTALALVAGLLAWAGAASQGADVSLSGMLEAGANCLPAAFLFLALAGLAFAAVPRATTIVAYGVVVVAFIWNLLGELLGAPGWTLGLSPFQHVGLVPIHSFRLSAAVAMLAIAACAVLASIAVFERRDLASA
jgi:polyether ionophore transport system permease protein